MVDTHIRVKKELYNRIKLLSNEFNISMNKMILKLLEVGYLKLISDEYED